MKKPRLSKIQKRKIIMILSPSLTSLKSNKKQSRLNLKPRSSKKKKKPKSSTKRKRQKIRVQKLVSPYRGQMSDNLSKLSNRSQKSTRRMTSRERSNTMSCLQTWNRRNSSS